MILLLAFIIHEAVHTVVVESADKTSCRVYYDFLVRMEFEEFVLCWVLVNFAQMLSFCLTVTVRV